MILLMRSAEAQVSGQGLEAEVPHLCEDYTTATASRKVVGRLEGELTRDQDQGEQELPVFQTRPDANSDMIHAVERDNSH